MDRKDQKGPERPRPPLWVGDEPVETVGDPRREQSTPSSETVQA